MTLVAATRIPDALPEAQQREKAEKLQRDGNYKDAYEAFSVLALNSKTEKTMVGRDLHNAVACLTQLNRVNEVDDFREKVIKAHSSNWRLLMESAKSYRDVQHQGYIISGKFERGHHRGGGKYANADERDRIRAIQLMEEAMKLTSRESDKKAVAQFHLEFSQMLMAFRGWQQSWHLQYLSDLSKLPDYEEGHYYGYYADHTRGAPVNEDGTPVYHKLPKSYADAATDGERWRWVLMQAAEFDPGLQNEVLFRFASFLNSQFAPNTMAQYSWYFRGGRNDDKDDESGPYALHTLADNETIARLATGVKRFTLPDEFDFVRIFLQVADSPRTGLGENALTQLAQLYEDRRQYPKAADYWRRNIEEYGPGDHQWKEKRLDQIVKNWGRFEPVSSQPAGKGATVDFLFRNGNKVSFEAHSIDMKTLLDDVKACIKARPSKLDWEQMTIDGIGGLLVQNKATKYVKGKVASWDLTLDPRSKHFDRKITVSTPLQKPGAYWVVSRMADGNESHIVLWVHDTVIVKKPLDNGVYYYVADAVTGKPVGRANVEFFGYEQKWVKDRTCQINIQQFAEFTDADGQTIIAKDKIPDNHHWLISATTEDGRFAHLGFSHVWCPNYRDADYNAVRTYVMTDRPVYRPKQTMKYKFWARHAKYDLDEDSTFSDRDFIVEIMNPKHEKSFEKTIKTDNYSGADGEFELPKDAPLGSYQIRVIIPNFTDPVSKVRHDRFVAGHGSFRVEEYKKPEFEVTVEAPTEPVMLGEKISATIKAKYYFGSPVTSARVKYKVTRSNHDTVWYAPMYWDWFYGPGYWWFAYDYDWYPGWKYWGCRRPWPIWWYRAHQPPEEVAEADVKIGEDGTVKVEIDTGVAKAVHGDTDHSYTITAEVVDESRRTIVGHGNVLVAHRPYKVYTWLHHGHYRAGDAVTADFSARTIANKPVKGDALIKLYTVTYDKDGKPTEKVVEEWTKQTDDEGKASLQFKAAAAGQYRLSCTVSDDKKHSEEGAYVFVVGGEGTKSDSFRFNEIELVADRKEYAPGDKVQLRVNTDQRNSTVILFTRPANGVYLRPKVLRLEGKSSLQEIEVVRKDMPNFFVEAMTIHNGKLFSETRELVVPPEKRVLNVDLAPSAQSYKPGEKATVKVKLTDINGKPFVGSTVMTMYDKAVEYISGGSNVAEIRQFFWKWRRSHHPSSESTVTRGSHCMVRPDHVWMGYVGAFGYVTESCDPEKREEKTKGSDGLAWGRGGGGPMPPGTALAPRASAKAAATEGAFDRAELGLASEANGAIAGNKLDRKRRGDGGTPDQTQDVQPVVRTKFADTAFWSASILTDAKGEAAVDITMPENLTGWKLRTWAMGHGTQVGEGTAEVVTAKKLMLRLQAPRFFVEKDEVVLSANIHNYLDKEKTVRAVLELDGPCLALTGPGERGASTSNSIRRIVVKSNGEQRVDWRIKVAREGEAVVRMKAITDEESDAMEMKFPVYVHGMLKMESWSGAIRPDKDSASVTIVIPKERRPEQTSLEIRYSPTLAGAMIDALPYLAAYPYESTDVCLSRFIPTVMTHKILQRTGVDLKSIREKRTNLNAQEMGDAQERARQWKRFQDQSAVFDNAVVLDMVKEGLRKITAMQLSDGGWGWFSGWGEHSSPHTTAYVVHGLQVAREYDVAIVPGVLDRGIEWLKRYENEQVRLLKNAATKTEPYKVHADNIDAFVFMVLVDSGHENTDMLEYLYRDRLQISPYGMSMFALALHRKNHGEMLAMVKQNIEQYLKQDDENQTAWLHLPGGYYWWYWYGSETETHAYYLKLLARTEPKSDKSSRVVKYLLNNRKHATYWNSTRDTSLCIEAMADFMKASGEDKPDMTVEILVDGKKHKEVRITPENLLAFDNVLTLTGDALDSGKHKVELRRKGAGPLYFNAYLTNFTIEDNIKKAGLEVRVDRKVYKLKKVPKTVKVSGSRGQALDQKVEKYEREELANLASLKSGDLIEVELNIESKNDYEYIVIEDMKAAGFEAVDIRSGYNRNELSAYQELRDERVAFLVRWLAHGKHSVSYRMRAEIPGQFSALPSKISAVYAPELKGNSDEIKLKIAD